MTITEFLLARLAEDETAARSALGEDPAPYREPGDWFGGDGPSGYSWVILSPERAIAECEAKRRIVEAVEYQLGGTNWRDAIEYAMREMASVYAEHPDFDPAWRT